jgi:hypothetical protein
MPKSHYKMKGGFLDSLGNTLISWGDSISEGASNIWNKTKNATTNAYNSLNGTPNYNSNYYGGRKKRTRRRNLRGGFKANSSSTDLAFQAAPVNNIKNAQPEIWLGKGYAQPQWLSLPKYNGGGYARPIQPQWVGGKSRKRNRNRNRTRSRRRN